MKIAFIISDKSKLTLGECLSSASIFYIYDTVIDSYYELENPVNEKSRHLSLVLSDFLQQEKISVVVGRDMGPKAKASLEERSIHWFIAEENTTIKNIIQLIKKKYRHE